MTTKTITLSIPIDTSYEVSLLPGCLPTIKASISDAFAERLQKVYQFTIGNVEKALSDIKWKATIKSFLAKPIVHIALGILLVGLANLIPAVGVAALVVQFVLSFASGVCFGFGAMHQFRGLLPRLSEKYNEISNYADKLLQELRQEAVGASSIKSTVRIKFPGNVVFSDANDADVEGMYN